MSQYIESISIESDGSSPLLSYHQTRIDRTIGDSNSINLQEVMESGLVINALPSHQQKLRIVYDKHGIKEQSIEPYFMRLIRSLTVVNVAFDYDHKHAGRDAINAAYNLRGESDDILMVKDGTITDTSYGNIACYLDGKWYTPESPLLGGCRRQFLLDNGAILPKKIRIEALNSYPYLTIFNALIPFGRILIPTHRILRSS